MIDVKDKPGCITKSEMRQYFERIVTDTPLLHGKIHLGTMEINGEFSHYMDSDTDMMWLGFALGMRCAEKLKI